MVRVEPVANINFKSEADKTGTKPEKKDTGKKNGALIAVSLAALAAAGAAAVGFTKTKPSTFEEALKKAGVEIKDNIAQKIGTEEKFTGKIEHFVSRNEKETVEYTNGVITEKVYHSAFGKELKGLFYKEGSLKCEVRVVGHGKPRHVYTCEYENNQPLLREHGTVNSDSVFEEYRKIMKSF